MTDPILLRPLQADDVTEHYVGWLNDPVIYRYLGIRHRARSFTAEDIRSFIEACREVRRFHWGIFFEGRHVGNVSCSEWSHANRWIDISYILGEKDVWGRGLAAAAVGAAIEHLFAAHPFNRVQAHAVMENTASVRVMEKLGMRRDALLRQTAYLPDEKRFTDETIYSILRSEWPQGLDCGWDRVHVTPMSWEEPHA